MKMLIVDDDLSNRMILLHMLRAYGDYDIAVNGKEALQCFIMAHKSKTPYDVIFLDIMMPDMDGHETLKEIRSWEEENLSVDDDITKVVMVSALSNPDNVLASFKEGCEYYLVKPISKQQVTDIMSKMGYQKEGS